MPWQSLVFPTKISGAKFFHFSGLMLIKQGFCKKIMALLENKSGCVKGFVIQANRMLEFEDGL